MSKLRTDLRVALAGVCCGLFGVSMFLLADRITSYHAYLRWLLETNHSSYDRGVEDLWWIPLVFVHVVMSIVASLLVHRYFTSDRISSFLRWQAIGLAALGGWGVLVFTVVGAGCLVRGTIGPFEQLWNEVKLIPVAQFIAAVFASNVLFGSAVQAASPQDISEDTQVRGSEMYR